MSGMSMRIGRHQYETRLFARVRDRIANAIIAIGSAGLASAAVATRQSAGHGLLVVSHAVRDFGERRQVFDEAADAKRRLGWIGSKVRAVEGDPRPVMHPNPAEERTP